MADAANSTRRTRRAEPSPSAAAPRDTGTWPARRRPSPGAPCAATRRRWCRGVSTNRHRDRCSPPPGRCRASMRSEERGRVRWWSRRTGPRSAFCAATALGDDPRKRLGTIVGKSWILGDVHDVGAVTPRRLHGRTGVRSEHDRAHTPTEGGRQRGRLRQQLDRGAIQRAVGHLAHDPHAGIAFVTGRLEMLLDRLGCNAIRVDLLAGDECAPIDQLAHQIVVPEPRRRRHIDNRDRATVTGSSWRPSSAMRPGRPLTPRRRRRRQ